MLVIVATMFLAVLCAIVSCASLGEPVSATVTAVENATIEQPVYKTVYVYFDKNTGKQTKSYEMPTDAYYFTGGKHFSEYLEQTGTETLSGVNITLSTGEQFFISHSNNTKYRFKTGDTVQYRPNRNRFDLKYVVSIDGRKVK